MFSVRTSWDQRCARPHSKWGIWTNSSRSERGSAACMANSRCGRSAWCGPPQGDTGRSDKTAPRDCWCAVWNEKKNSKRNTLRFVEKTLTRYTRKCEVSTDHLLHTVPVHQSVWISEVGLIVLIINYHKLATGGQRENTLISLAFFSFYQLMITLQYTQCIVACDLILIHINVSNTFCCTHLACRKSSLLKGLCLWPHLLRRPQQEWPSAPEPKWPPRGSNVKLSRWFRLIFLGPANWAGLNSARQFSAT